MKIPAIFSIILAAVAGFGVVYLLGAFHEASFDVSTWAVRTRGGVGGVGGFVGFVTAIIAWFES